MNRVELIGGLTKDPEWHELESGFGFVSFTLAVNGARYSGQAGGQIITTDYIALTAWGETGSRLHEEVRKGDELHVLGKLDQRELVRKDGSKDSKTRVAVFTYDVVRRARRTTEARF